MAPPPRPALYHPLKNNKRFTKLCDELSAGITVTFSITWRRGYRDHEGGSPRMRPFRCTTVGLTPAKAPNVGISGA
ncbi:hypothetical protein J6590_084402 [Homalodisca vitripennis]|nr:hypothetical protein J6590_084402 [Homalodisca vitripennis]